MFNGTSGLTASDVLALSNNDGFGGNNGAWWIIILAILFGWGNGGFGGYGAGGINSGYTLASDFATIQRQLSDGFGATESKLDSVNNGLCSLGYDQLGQFNNVNTNVLQSANLLQSQLADCCCKTQSGIESVKTADAFNTANVVSAIKDCCCEEKAQFADIKYTMATENCATRQAIADGTKQIIDYMANKEAQALRDENQSLKLCASQSAQNQYIINALRPFPVPSFNVGYNPYSYGIGYGTTIA